MLGAKVYMKNEVMEWVLDNPEVFLYGDEPIASYNAAVYHALLNLIGGRLIGKVVDINTSFDTYGVSFNTPFGVDFFYCAINDVVIVNE